MADPVTTEVSNFLKSFGSLFESKNKASAGEEAAGLGGAGPVPTNVSKSDLSNSIAGKFWDWLSSTVENYPESLEASGPSGAKFEPFVPKDKSGETPEGYTPDVQKIQSLLQNAGPESGTQISESSKQLEDQLSDKEYEQLEKASASGNKLAMSLLTAYKPKYGKTWQQEEQSFTQPFVNALKQLPSEVDPLVAQEEALQPSVQSSIAQVQQQAESEAPANAEIQQPNATTNALMGQYASASAPSVITSDMEPMISGLQDLANAAQISQKTFPYEGMISDLLNRYAYQIESPSYEPSTVPSFLPDYLQKLIQASTGVSVNSGGSSTSNLGVADQTGISTPSLAPSGGVSSTAGG